MNLAFLNVDQGFRYMFAINIIASFAIFYVSVFKMKESPRWLVLKGREEEARPMLAEIFGKQNGKKKKPHVLL